MKVNSSGNVEATTVTTKASTTYNTSTSDQTIESGTYLTGTQTIKAVTTSGIEAGNIKDGATITVGDDNSATRIKNVTGTFTDASTVSSGQMAAAAAQIRTGYSAWVDGAEVKGSIANLATKTYNTSTSDQTIASGKYISGTQTIKAVTTSGIDAENIKKGVTVTVGDANSSTRIKNVTGTFTTTPTGKSAITAATVRSGYSGFINGAQVDGTMPDATFANEATSGKTYTDISSTAPVLVAGDYLYINEGYTPYSKISLAKLVPDGSDVKGHGEYIISGHSAYDNDGTLVAGSIPALTANDVSVSGATVTIPVGKHTGESGATAVTKTITSGTVTTVFTGDGMSTYFNSGSSSDKDVTITPKYTNTAGYVSAHSTATNNGGVSYYKIKTVSGSIGGSASGGSATAAISNVNSMNTITNISGKTAGTDYWTVKATATGGAGSYTPKYTVTTAGWIASTVTGTAQTVSVSSDSTGKSIYIPKAVLAGSSTDASATTTVAPGTVSVAKQDVPSGVTQAASGDATTTAPSSGVYVAVLATAAANSTGTTSSISGSGSATVTTAGYAPTTLTGSITVSGTATAKTSAKNSSVTYVPITTATPTFSSPTPSGGSTATGTNVTLSTTNNGMLVQTKYSVNQATVTYNATVEGWVSKENGEEAVKTTARSSTNGTAYYVTGVTMPKNKGFTVTTTADTALDTTSDLDVTNNAYRRVDITNNANGTVLVTGAGSTEFVAGSATTGNLTVSAYNASGTAENDKAIVVNGKWNATSVSAGGTYYGRVTVGSGSATTPATTITANPTITISSGGLITATSSATQSVTPTVTAGYVGSGTAGTITVSGTKTSQMTVQAAKTWTPTTTNQTIATGTYLTGAQTIAGDANLKPENIKSDVTIFGVAGSYTGTAPVITRTTDSHGGQIVEISTDAEYDWRGPELEFVQNIVGYDVALADTSFATWTPSTTATTIKAAANSSSTFTANMADYEYIIEWKTWADIVYNDGVTPKATTKTVSCYAINTLCRRPSTMVNIRNHIYDSSISYTANGVLQTYYNSSGVETPYYATTYGMYASPAAATFASATASSTTVTPKTPSIAVRCNSTYFATGMASNINQTATIFHATGKLYRCRRGTFARGCNVENVEKLYNERG